MDADPTTTLPPSSTTSVASINSLAKTANTPLENLKAPPVEMQEGANADKSDMENIGETPVAEKVVSQGATASPQNPEEQEDESKYPDKFKLALIVLSLNLATFLIGLDNTIISTAIPRITDQFHALDDVGWYASSYLLTTCAFQLMWGKLYTFYSIKWTYLVGLFIFELGSLICAVAPTSTALIVGRAIAGLGSAGVSCGSFILIAHSVPQRQRPTLVGMISGIYGFAAIAGPLLGGAFTDNAKLTWRWCFYINLPLGLITAIIVLFCLHSSGGKNTNTFGFMDLLKQMDLLGTTFILPGVICLLLALQWGGTKYEWKNGRIIALLILAGLLLIGFVAIQVRSGEHATVPPHIFGNRNIWGSAIFGACVMASFFVILYYIPIWFQAIKGASAIKSGIMNLPMILSFVVFSALGGILTSVTGHYVQFVYLTVVFLAVGTGLLTTLEVDSGHAKWIGYQIIFGAGVGFGLQAAFTVPQTALSLQDVPIGIAIIMFSESLTGAIMVSVAQSVFTNQLAKNLSTYVPTIDPSIVLNIGATQIKSQVPEEFYNAVLFAYNKALTQTFYVGVVLPCCSVLGVVWLQWLSIKVKKIDTAHTV